MKKGDVVLALVEKSTSKHGSHTVVRQAVLTNKRWRGLIVCRDVENGDQLLVEPDNIKEITTTGVNHADIQRYRQIHPLADGAGNSAGVQPTV